MKFITKYALAAALVIPSVFAFGSHKSEAASAVINKDLANGVNVRSEAKLGDNIIGLIDDEDSQYEIKDKKDGWLLIDFEDKDAYVSADLFHLLEETELVSAANFRKEASLDSEIIEVLDKGTAAKALEIADNGFVKVEIDGKVGYVYNNLLKTFREKNEKVKAQKVQEQKAQAKKAQAAKKQAPAKNTNQSYKGSTNWAKEWIAQRESGGSYTAYNPRGGYYGRYQLNPSLVRYGASPAEQEAAADNYVAQRYGSWENAQAFWQRNGWY